MRVRFLAGRLGARASIHVLQTEVLGVTRATRPAEHR